MLANGFAPTDAQSIVSVFGWWHARCWVSPERWFGLTLHITLFGVGGSGRSPVSPPTPGSGGWSAREKEEVRTVYLNRA